MFSTAKVITNCIVKPFLAVWRKSLCRREISSPSVVMDGMRSMIHDYRVAILVHDFRVRERGLEGVANHLLRFLHVARLDGLHVLGVLLLRLLFVGKCWILKIFQYLCCRRKFLGGYAN